jgi:ADP-ribose pyrophosphatase
MKIPSTAKKVFDGIIYDVYQWEQEMFDGTKQTFEMLKRPNSIEVISTVGNKIVLSKQSQPSKNNFYSLFGGRAEEGEEPLTTAKRELLEESGLKSEDWELLKTYTPMHKIDWDAYMYVARNCIQTGCQKLDAGEKIEIVNCTFDEFIEIVESDNYLGDQLILDVLKMKHNGKLEEFRKKIFEK